MIIKKKKARHPDSSPLFYTQGSFPLHSDLATSSLSLSSDLSPEPFFASSGHSLLLLL